MADGTEVDEGTAAPPGAADGGTAAGLGTTRPPIPTFPGSRAPTVTPGSAPPPQIERNPDIPQTVTERMQQQSWGSKTYHGILAALGGANDTSFYRDPQTGRMTMTTVPSSPGSQWKRIIAGALTGYAAGAGLKGPGSTAAKFGAGIQAGQKLQQGAEDRARQQATEDFEQQQKAATADLNRSLLQHQIARSTYELGDAKIQASERDVQLHEQWEQMIEAGGNGTQKIGIYATPTDAYAAAKKSPELHDLLANGHISFTPHIDENGQIRGVEAAIVTPSWLKSRTSAPVRLEIPAIDENGKPYMKQQDIEAGEMTNEAAMNLHGSLVDQALKVHKSEQEDREAKAREKLTGAQIAGAYAEAEQKGAETAMSNYELEFLKKYGFKPGTEKMEKPGAATEAETWGPQGQAGFDKWDEKVVQPVTSGAEVSFQLAANAYNEFRKYQAAGQQLPTGAPAMMMFSSHIQTTFGRIKGTRLNKELIQDHFGARSVSDDAQVAVNKLYNGDPLSAKQWTAFMDLISQSREEQWHAVWNSARALGRPVDKVEFPPELEHKFEAEDAAAGAKHVKRTTDQAQPPAGPTAATPGTLATPGPNPTAAGPPPNPQTLTQMGVSLPQWNSRPQGATGTVVNRTTGQRHWSSNGHDDLGAVK